MATFFIPETFGQESCLGEIKDFRIFFWCRIFFYSRNFWARILLGRIEDFRIFFWCRFCHEIFGSRKNFLLPWGFFEPFLQHFCQKNLHYAVFYAEFFFSKVGGGILDKKCQIDFFAIFFFKLLCSKISRKKLFFGKFTPFRLFFRPLCARTP